MLSIEAIAFISSMGWFSLGITWTEANGTSEACRGFACIGGYPQTFKRRACYIALHHLILY
jgi:hypothetical protein